MDENREGLCQGTLFEGDILRKTIACDVWEWVQCANMRRGLRMEDVGGMIHAFLKSTIKVGECFCAASEAKVFA